MESTNHMKKPQQGSLHIEGLKIWQIVRVDLLPQPAGPLTDHQRPEAPHAMQHVGCEGLVIAHFKPPALDFTKEVTSCLQEISWGCFSFLDLFGRFYSLGKNAFERSQSKTPSPRNRAQPWSPARPRGPSSSWAMTSGRPGRRRRGAVGFGTRRKLFDVSICIGFYRIICLVVGESSVWVSWNLGRKQSSGNWGSKAM